MTNEVKKEEQVVVNENKDVNKVKNDIDEFGIELTDNDTPEISVEGVVFKKGVIVPMSKLTKKQLEALVEYNFLSKNKKTGLQGLTVKKIG